MYLERESANGSQRYEVTDEFRDELWKRIEAGKGKRTEVCQGSGLSSLRGMFRSFLHLPLPALAAGFAVVCAVAIWGMPFMRQGQRGVFVASFDSARAKGEVPGESEALKTLVGNSLQARVDFRTDSFSVQLSDGSTLTGRLAANPQLNRFSESGKEFFEVKDLHGTSTSGAAIGGHVILQIRRTDATKPLSKMPFSALRFAKFQLELSNGSNERFADEYEFFPSVPDSGTERAVDYRTRGKN
jgi:hypothetical protein